MKKSDGSPKPTVQAVFKGYPDSFRLYQFVKKKLMMMGPVKKKATKTQIAVAASKPFVWIRLPQTWIKKRDPKGIALTFQSNKRIRAREIEESTEVKAGRWTHHILLSTERDFSSNVEKWLRQAYSEAKHAE